MNYSTRGNGQGNSGNHGKVRALNIRGGRRRHPVDVGGDVADSGCGAVRAVAVDRGGALRTGRTGRARGSGRALSALWPLGAVGAVRTGSSSRSGRALSALRPLRTGRALGNGEVENRGAAASGVGHAGRCACRTRCRCSNGNRRRCAGGSFGRQNRPMSSRAGYIRGWVNRRIRRQGDVAGTALGDRIANGVGCAAAPRISEAHRRSLRARRSRQPGRTLNALRALRSRRSRSPLNPLDALRTGRTL